MKLVKGKKAASPKGMAHNVKTMEKAGYSKKRAEGTAYGEVGMEKKARKDESKAMKKHMDEKQDKALIRKSVKKDCMKKMGK
ncbi:MAG: hypothetical protein [Bacteriophage sp.]|nr:MAG: hypothetical protein [Bacteriophage sp.]